MLWYDAHHIVKFKKNYKIVQCDSNFILKYNVYYKNKQKMQQNALRIMIDGWKAKESFLFFVL